jgi:hypothetical protein
MGATQHFRLTVTMSDFLCKQLDQIIGGRWLFQEYKWFIGKAPESMQSAVFSIVFPKFEYKCHPNHLYAPTAYGPNEPQK